MPLLSLANWTAKIALCHRCTVQQAMTTVEARMKVVYLINSRISGHHLGSLKSIIDPSDHHLSLLNIACALNMLHANDYGFVKQSMKAGLAVKTCHATRYASRQAG